MAASALVCVALVFVSVAYAQYDQCTTQTYGITSGSPINLPIVDLPPPNPTWDVQIPQSCPNGNAGVKVTVCDPNGPPPATVMIKSATEAIVLRSASPILQAAKVYTTVYCSQYQSFGQGAFGAVKTVAVL